MLVGFLPLLLIGACRLIEIVCVLYSLAFTIAAVRYLAVRRRRPEPPPPAREFPPAAVVYLCCGDLDTEAVESLSRLRYPGSLLHVLHDDSTNSEANRRVDDLVRRIGMRSGVEWLVLRRPEHRGGKPGALQYVLEQTAHRHEFFLLADNDSLARDPDLLAEAIGSFADPGVGIVQFRNRARTARDDGPLARTLAPAIDAFDAFALGLFEPLWMPFVGHNAVLRTQAVLDAGGFTPGFFADDIDLTLRMNLRGVRVRYRRDLEMFESHPSNYRSFCTRSRKWAIGCAQVLRTHLGAICASRELRPREKLGFLLFTGFYASQIGMLLFVAQSLLVLPWLASEPWTPGPWTLLVGTLVPAGVFLPVAAYLLTEGRELPFFRTLLGFSLTYGSTDLWTASGVIAGMRRRERRWVPTNCIAGQHNTPIDWFHFGIGAALLGVPLGCQPTLLLFPLTWLFAAKFLFVPVVALAYAPGVGRARRLPVPGIVTSALLLLACLSGLPHGSAKAGAAKSTVEIRDGRILIDGRATIVRGVHYSPWRPGTGPGKDVDYPPDAELEQDLALIRSLDANAILVYEAPARLLDLAGRYGLHVLYAFHIPWEHVTGESPGEAIPNLEARVRELATKPALLGWMVGNEAPAHLIDALGADGVRRLLSGLREQIRSTGARQPVCYGNWPLSRTADLDRDMDLLCYNVYPFFPPEVAARGYSTYIREEILSRAAGRPLLVTEFGMNTLETTPERQVQIISQSWSDLLIAGAQGGMVFSFADEWWKNYSNPIRPPDWWRRADAWDDQLTQDQDPEEYYGIVGGDRVPKPAFDAVRTMFERQARAEARAGWMRSGWWWAGGAAAIGLIGLALGARWIFRAPPAPAGEHARIP